MQTVAERGKRICFSGCGSTGRLSVMLEEMWRQFWEDRADLTPGEASLAKPVGSPPPAEAAQAARRASQRCSIMTGEDRGLIRAVEHFEDHARFGAQQVADLDLQAGDHRGGETASVLGTVVEARQRGCEVFVASNNK